MKASEISVERGREGLTLYTIVNGYLMSRLYIGYTVRQAKALFIEEVNK